MRVSVVMPSAAPTGGAEEAFLQLLRAEAAATVQFQVLFLEEGPLIPVVRRLVSHVRVVPCGRTREVHRWWRAAGHIREAAESFNSSLLLGWMTKGQAYGGLAAWRGRRVAAWFQMGFPETGLLDRAARRLPAAKVFTCSEFVAQRQRAAQPQAEVQSVHLGVDTKRFDPGGLPCPSEARVKLGLPAAGPLVGTVGRLQRWKGMHTLIESMPTLLHERPDAHALIVGGPCWAEPGYECELRNQARALGVADRVIFAGAQSDVPRWMQAMDVFVHASIEEPFGIVVVEALALGKPVVSYRPGGPEEILAGVPGTRLLGRRDPAELAVAVDAILTEVPKLPDGRDARIQTAASFSSELFASALIDHCRGLMPALPRSPRMAAE